MVRASCVLKSFQGTCISSLSTPRTPFCKLPKGQQYDPAKSFLSGREFPNIQETSRRCEIGDRQPPPTAPKVNNKTAAPQGKQAPGRTQEFT